ncbi:MAG: FAD-binding oxidoreductase [Actinomycetota bacterium]|nr:FAD-binding oxidoreductase [Actinomycetota bacterium]
MSRLRDDLRGEVIGREDGGYDAARTVFPGNIDRRPAAIVRPVDAAEVSIVVSLARDTGLELAVRCGGHSGPGFGVCDGGIVLDLSAMKGLDIDADGHSAWAETGLTAAEYSSAAGEHGLATGFGDTGSVGIGGLTLGGGIGFLVRKYGMTIDDLLAAEVVTADGELLRVDDESHPDLFWAIRGGGGNFGVATRFRFRLHDVPSIVGGILMLPATQEVIASFVEEAEAAPEELTTIANVMKAPPMPFVPEEHHGELAIFALMAYAGETDAGERAVAPFRALAEPLADMLQPMSYPEIYMPDEETYHPIAVGQTRFADHVDEAAATTILDRITESSAMMAVTQIRALGRAMARVPADATAFAHRGSRLMVTVAAVFEQVEEAPQHQAWVDDLAGILRQDDHGAYVNFLGEEGEAGIREAYPGPTWHRLRSIKRAYDPDNLFRLNQNIPPASEAS